MKLSQLIKDLKVEKIIGTANIDIVDVCADSNEVNKGSLFICINGSGFDGHNFIRQVELFGAVAVVCTRELSTSLTQIIVKDERAALSAIAAAFYGHVDKKMKLIAVLGTNGKTTVSHLIKNVLDGSGINTGVIGTLGAFYLDKKVEPTLTTPDPLTLHKILFDMYSSGVKTVVMEVSAHAVYYEKVKGMQFFASVFTNFSQDHLDFFESMEKYKQAKLEFFKQNKCKYTIVNSDDEVGLEICKLVPKSITYGMENPSDIFAIDVKSHDKGSRFVINLFDCVYSVDIKLIGTFNVYNALAAACAAALMGVKPEKIINLLEKIKPVEGRLEKIYDGDISVYVDYAHTPDGLEKSLSSLNSIKKGRLICVFGCGGNRDASKRSIMGKISATNCDFTVITSDNPRFEEPMEIIRNIENGVLEVNKKFISIEDREQAIFYAINMAKKDDVVLIAGKGSEKYQEVLGIKKPYNDKDTVKEYFRRR